MDIIDIHTHILFGIDDGARTAEQSVEMLKVATENGTSTIFLTPHCTRADFNIQKAKESIEKLAKIAKEQFPQLSIYGGSEILYTPSAIEGVLQGKIPTLAKSDYILLEFFPSVYYTELVSAVKHTVASGLIPVIAHAERYTCLYKKGLDELIEYGAYIQINANSVMGKNGLGAKLFCKKQIKKGAVHFIASDGHDTKKRSTNLSGCAKYIEKTFGQNTALQLFSENPKRIINNN